MVSHGVEYAQVSDTSSALVQGLVEHAGSRHPVLMLGDADGRPKGANWI